MVSRNTLFLLILFHGVAAGAEHGGDKYEIFCISTTNMYHVVCHIMPYWSFCLYGILSILSLKSSMKAANMTRKNDVLCIKAYQ